MDDTDLIRPPRHDRDRTYRRAAVGAVSRACTCGHGSAEHDHESGACSHSSCGCDTFVAFTGVMTKPCVTCGGQVVLELESNVPQFLAALARLKMSGEAEARCSECQAIEDAQQERAERAAARAELIALRRSAARIPQKWLGQTFAQLDDAPERRRALELAAQWGSGARQGLVLWGPVGRGKTAIAAAAVNARIGRGAVRWLPVAELLTALRMPFDSPEYARAVRKLEATGSAALVLDDLDKLKPTEHAVQPLYVAVNAWIEAELPLLVTLNRDLDELEEWMPDTFGEAIASRLAGYCAITEVGGIDRRLVGS